LPLLFTFTIMARISKTDLILNEDGSVYHLNLLPEDIAETVITMGDPERVAAVSKYFDSTEVKKSKREFTTHTGYIGNKRLTVLSTGIGTDNIDIVLNELDALVNINPETREINKNLKSLDIIRIGTSGAVQPGIPVDSILVSETAIGLDSLMHYYRHAYNDAEKELLMDFIAALPPALQISPYVSSSPVTLRDDLAKNIPVGITISAPGFYAPQGREVRAQNAVAGLMQAVQQFSSAGRRITNLEMETAGIYGLAAVLGHRAISFNVILANRITQTFSSQPQKAIDNCIQNVLDRIMAITDN